MIRIISALVLFIGLYHSGYAQNQDCKEKKNANGIIVYVCKTDNAQYKSLKAEFTIDNTTLDELVAFMKNVNNYPKWQYNMVSAKMLKRESDDIMITRSEIDAPWPVENRELIVQYEMYKYAAQDSLHVTAKTIPYDYPKSDLVRIPFSHAEWFVKKAGNVLKISYTLNVNPGGSLPAWLVNMALAEGPFHTFTNLKKELENN
jgi:DNA polymerase III sliding clamp (beta) subunit (PCNA family)